ncbi:MAG: hypothetical protein Q7R39_12235 [Dehalococcoidia bacterium]|nr:hypothetical protein [Dehalococcoidia bacterium]
MPEVASKRVQALFSPGEYALLEEYARETGRSLGAVVRDSVAEHLLADLVKARRRKALERILGGPGEPVKDWPEMEKELEESRYACDDGIL